MGWIELAPEDREKYGTPERIPLDYGRWGLKSIDALEADVGLTVEDLTNALRTRSRTAIVAVVWLSLRAIGIRIPWADFDIQGRGLVVSLGDEEEGDEGKAESPEEGSETDPQD